MNCVHLLLFSRTVYASLSSLSFIRLTARIDVRKQNLKRHSLSGITVLGGWDAPVLLTRHKVQV